MKNTELKYKVIKSDKQYYNYCNILEGLVDQAKKVNEEEIELLTLLIEKWDDEHEIFDEHDPVQLLKTFMLEHKLRATDLTKILNLSKGTVSKILNYQKGLSKETIRKLANHFRVRQEAFNRPYKLKNAINRRFKDASLMNTQKVID